MIVKRNSNGDFHCEDGPAIVWSNGDKAWFINGVRHREDGPAIEYETFVAWYNYGKRHRIGGPAIIRYISPELKHNPLLEYWVNDMLHREDGPAIEGGLAVLFYLFGEPISKKKYLSAPIDQLLPEVQMIRVIET